MLSFRGKAGEAILLQGEAKLREASKQKRLSFKHLIQMLVELTDYYLETGENDKAQTELTIALNVMEAFNPNFGNAYIRPLRELRWTGGTGQDKAEKCQRFLKNFNW